MFYQYFPSNRVAGYSGFVMYFTEAGSVKNVWMVPGTFFDDWDNK